MRLKQMPTFIPHNPLPRPRRAPTPTANRSTEDYIKAIFLLMMDRTRVTTSALAARLRVRDASATGMIKKLSARNLVRYERYGGVDLTRKGRRLALLILRRHRLWEMFLVRFLEFPWERVHEEAERLEHVTSDEMEQKLDKVLGYPRLDPHGDPIPTAAGDLTRQTGLPLSECGPGDKVRVSRVSDRDPEILLHAARLGLSLSAKVTVVEKARFDGSLVIRIGSRKRFVSNRLAGCIFVDPS
jgi:DtxR family transcriptional regulator, Mn-dependent transcriptional regulator